MFTDAMRVPRERERCARLVEGGVLPAGSGEFAFDAVVWGRPEFHR